MGAAQHRWGLTTFPFPMFGGAWMHGGGDLVSAPDKGDLTVGNDVWIGMGATLMAGITVGDGVHLASCSLAPRSSATDAALHQMLNQLHTDPTP